MRDEMGCCVWDTRAIGPESIYISDGHHKLIKTVVDQTKSHETIKIEANYDSNFNFIFRLFSFFLLFSDPYSSIFPTRQQLPPIPPRFTLPGVDVKLLNKELWEDFHKIGTEMIITKCGRWAKRKWRAQNSIFDVHVYLLFCLLILPFFHFDATCEWK